MMQSPATKVKTAYKPYIKKVSDTEFTVQSERYVYVLYLVTVRPDGSTSCDCTAGSFNRRCKHGAAVAAYMAYRANPSHIRSAAPVARPATSAAGLLEAFGVAS